MKRLALLLTLLPSAAFAGDINSPYTKAPASYVAYNWGGWYVGGNVGYGMSKETTAIAPTNANAGIVSGLGLVPTSQNPSSNGVIGGGQVGYNYQISPMWLVGVEATMNGSDIKGSQSHTFSAAPLGFPASLTTNTVEKLNWYGTVVGKVGLTMDRAMLYGVGGLAYGDFTRTNTISLSTPIPAINGSAVGSSSGKTGWTAGLGLEYAMTQNWRAGLEGGWVDFGNESAASSATVAKTPFIFSHSGDMAFAYGKAKISYSLGDWLR